MGPTVQVRFTEGFARAFTGGVREFVRAMNERVPGLGERLVEETTVAIDGMMHEPAYFQPVPPGGEVFFFPKLEGG